MRWPCLADAASTNTTEPQRQITTLPLLLAYSSIFLQCALHPPSLYLSLIPSKTISLISLFSKSNLVEVYSVNTVKIPSTDVQDRCCLYDLILKPSVTTSLMFLAGILIADFLPVWQHLGYLCQLKSRSKRLIM